MKINKLTLLSLILSITTIAMSLGGCGLNNPSQGEKIGQIVRLNKSGILCDTWEGQLIRGGMSGGSGTVGIQPFDFTVEDESLIPVLQEYLENQTEVLIKYRSEGVYSVFRTDSGGHS